MDEQNGARAGSDAHAATHEGQAWFWTERWQSMEREADQDIAAGRSMLVDGLEGMIEHLDE